MDKRKYINYIESYLQDNGWEGKNVTGDIWYTKGYVPEKSHKKKYIELNKIYDVLQKNFRAFEHQEFHYDSVINPNGDTDYIIAGIQLINSMKENDRKVRKSIYSFQPVIRSVPIEKMGQPGYLPCFVNVCVVDINASIKDFIERVEEWITILSKCSIHISSLRMKIKYHTNAYDGIGLKICVHDEEIGQCNVYKIDSYAGLVLDFGFGLERICWAANDFTLFDSICQKYENFGLKNTDYSRIVSFIVLMLKSGVRPNSSKFGLKLRNMFEKYTLKYAMWDFSDTVEYYYQYWSKFILNEISVEKVMNMFKTELIYQKKRIIANNAKSSLPKKSDAFENDELVLHYLRGHRYE